jgi:Mce-associated membrane protein
MTTTGTPASDTGADPREGGAAARRGRLPRVPGRLGAPGRLGIPGRLGAAAAANPLTAAGVALATVAACCAGWFGTSLLNAANSGPLAYSRARDSVLRAAEQGVLNLNTMDYRHARQDFGLWLASSTGQLRAGLARNLPQEVQVARRSKLVTSARILDSAVTRLDAAGGTASVMISLDFTVTVSGARPATKLESELGHLTRTSSGWKLSNLCPASSCQASGTAPSPGASAAPSATASPAP